MNIKKLFLSSLFLVSSMGHAISLAAQERVSHEMAINLLQYKISQCEMRKARVRWIDNGKKAFDCVSVVFLFTALLPGASHDTRVVSIWLAGLMQVPRLCLYAHHWFIDREIGFLREQIERLKNEVHI